MKWVVIIVLFFNSVCFAGELYIWVDDNGVKHFGDTEPAGIDYKSITVDNAQNKTVPSTQSQQYSGLIKNVNLIDVSVICEIKDDRLRFLLQPVVSNDNDSLVDIRFELFFYDIEGVEINKCFTYEKINAFTKTTTPFYICSFSKDEQGYFYISLVKSILVRYSLDNEHKEKTDIKLTIKNNTSQQTQLLQHENKKNNSYYSVEFADIIPDSTTNNRMKITGRIYGNDSCKQLKVKIPIANEKEEYKLFTFTVSHTSSSSLFEKYYYTGQVNYALKHNVIKENITCECEE